MFFIKRQYRQDKPMRGRLRSALSSSCPLYRSGTFQRTKKYFVYGKICSNLSNYTQQEQDNPKNEFGDCYPE